MRDDSKEILFLCLCGAEYGAEIKNSSASRTADLAVTNFDALVATNTLVNVRVAMGSQSWREVLSTIRTVCMFYLNVLDYAYTGYNSHCATHQIRVILISCVVITSLFYPALDVYTSSKYSSPATFLALTYFFPAVAQNAEVTIQFPEASPIALEVCIRRDPFLTVYTHYASIPV